MKNKTIKLYTDGATVRLHNRRISFKQDEKSIMIKFSFAEADAYRSACSHDCHRGKVRETNIKMTNEAMEALVLAFMNYKRAKYIEHINKINNTTDKPTENIL